jgi:hypothetical protein
MNFSTKWTADRASHTSLIKQFIHLLTPLVCGLALAACEAKSTDVLKSDYVRSLTEQELQQVLATEHFSAIAVEHSKDVTLILFDSSKGAGTILYRAKVAVYEETHNPGATFPSNNYSRTGFEKTGQAPSTSKVLLTSQSINEIKPFVGIVIHDPALLQQIASIKIIFDNGREKIISINGKRGILYHYNSVTELCCEKAKTVFYSAAGKEINTGQTNQFQQSSASWQ